MMRQKKNEMFTLLKKLAGLKKIVSIHYTTDQSSAGICISFGFIDVVNDKYVRIHVVSTLGEDAGYDVVRLNRICRVDIGGKYERKFEFLYENKEHVSILTKLSPRKKNTDILTATLKEAFQKKLIVTIWTKGIEEGIDGYIKSIEKDTIILNVVNDYGEEDGLTILWINEIDSIECDTPKLRLRKFLHENQQL